MVKVHTSQITSTNSIHLNYTSYFGNSTIFAQVISSEMWPSWNTTCFILNRFYHLFLVGSFSSVAALIHTFRCSDCIPDNPPTRPMWSPLTFITIPFPPGVPSGISSIRTRISIVSPSGGHYLWRSSLLADIFPIPSLVGSGGCYLAGRYQHCMVPQAYLI